MSWKSMSRLATGSASVNANSSFLSAGIANEVFPFYGKHEFSNIRF